MTLSITNLSKSYGRAAALDHVNLVLQPAIYGLFGRNGSGKSTLLGLIANRLLPGSGVIALDGVNVRDDEQAQSRIYLVNETLPFLLGAKVGTILHREERYYGGFDWGFASRMLAEFGVLPGAMYGALSFGQRMIVRLVAALCVPVDVLLLDEPVLGLDAANRELFYRFLLESYGERPRIVVVATHLIGEIAHVVERVVVLDHGRLADEFAAESVGLRATALVGAAPAVDGFVADGGLTPLSRESLGRLSTVVVRGSVDVNDLPEGVVASGLGLQDYVIRLTDEKGVSRSAETDGDTNGTLTDIHGNDKESEGVR